MPIIPFLILLIHCSTFDALNKNKHRPEGKKEYVYAGVRTGSVFSSVLGEFPNAFVCLAPVILIDFTFSLAADTVLLPVTIPLSLADAAHDSTPPAAKKAMQPWAADLVAREFNSQMIGNVLSMRDLPSARRHPYTSSRFRRIFSFVASFAARVPPGYVLRISGGGEAFSGARTIYRMLIKRGVPAANLQVVRAETGKVIDFFALRLPAEPTR